MSLIFIRSNIQQKMNAPITALFGDSVMQDQIRKHSTLFNDSSDSDGEVRNTDEVVVTDIVPALEFFEAFVNKFTDKFLRTEPIKSNCS